MKDRMLNVRHGDFFITSILYVPVERVSWTTSNIIEKLTKVV